VIRGNGWRADAFGGAAPSVPELDAVVRDRPVILPSADLNVAWRNSRAAGLPIVSTPKRS
jgi:predicted amidohydrolase YtcJ